MIIVEKPSWLRLVFRMQGSALTRIWRRVLFITLVATAFTRLQRYPAFHYSLSLTPFLLVGLPLGIILGFRNTAAYDRYWEGRKLWGSLVNTSRTLTRQVMTLVTGREGQEPPAAEALAGRHRELCLRTVAFVHAVRFQLRRERTFDELTGLLPAEEIASFSDEPNPAAAILHGTGERLLAAKRAGLVEPICYPLLEASLTQLTDVLGACERIKNTPAPVGYAIFIHRAVAMYCLLLPFGVADAIGTLTPLVAFFVAYAFFSLDAIGDGLEDPFRIDQHHLPLTAISRNIEIYIRRRLGETDLPAVLVPRDGILDLPRWRPIYESTQFRIGRQSCQSFRGIRSREGSFPIHPGRQLGQSARMTVSQLLMAGVVLGGEFEIVKPIGQGGMGTVYEAVQRATGAQRAVKVMRSGLATDPRFRARFDQEARVSARIPSDHVVQVVGAGVDEATRMPWIAMELLVGNTLADWLESRTNVAGREIAAMLEQLCHALGAAHEVGVVHRDLKPENIFLSKPRAVGSSSVLKVLDFGVAKIVSEARGVTVAVGTPAYMAPEQTAASADVGPPADVWALGLLAFRLLTGRPYWRALATGDSSPVQLWREVLVDPLAPASERAREHGGVPVPPLFDEWFAHCVHRDMNERFANAGLAYQALAPVLAMMAGAATPVSSSSSPVTGDGATMLPTSTQLSAVLSAGPRTGTSKITFREPNERVVLEGARGGTLLEISLANGIPHHHVCGGRARCTTCRVVVLDGMASAGPRTDAEVRVAEQRKWPAPIRLACQMRVLGDMTVRRLVVDDDDRDTVNASISTEEPGVEQAVVVAMQLPRFSEFMREHLPYDTVHVLNRYLRQVCEPALASRGTILRYERAGALISFGNDAVGPSALEDAVRASLRAMARAKQLNGYVLRHFGQQLDLAIGIHAGQLMRAAVGHPTRLDQIILGDGIEGALEAARTAHENSMSIVATSSALALAPGALRLGRVVSAGALGEHAELLDFARPDVVLLVQSTFERLEGKWSEFAERFYERLFEMEPSLARLFDHVDMHAQRDMLMQVLATAIKSLDDLEPLVPVLRQLGARHVAYGARTGHYKLVGRALLEALEAFLGPDFTPEVHLAWMEIYGTLAREMIEGSQQATNGG